MGKGIPTYALLCADLVAIPTGFALSYWIRFHLLRFIPPEFTPTFAQYWAPVLLTLGIWLLLFRALHMDRFYEGVEVSLAISRLITAVTVLVVCLLALSYLGRIYYSRLVVAILSVSLVLLLLATRLTYQSLLKWLRKYRVGLRRVVIVGRSQLAGELAERIERHRELHYELVGFLAPASGRKQAEGNVKDSGGTEQMIRQLVEKRVDELIFAMPIRRDTEILDFVARCQKLGIGIKVVPEYYELHASQLKSFEIDGIPIFTLKETCIEPAYRMLKSVMDYLLAVVLLLILGPLMAIVSLILYLAADRRVIRRETRVGLEGRSFVLYRFDTSLAEALPAQRGSAFGVWFCRFLYRYSLSELPQLWNVLKGEMSVVGPRPETPERVRHYSAWHQRRLQLRPGITGLAQVKGLRGADSSDAKTKHDLEYAANFSPFLDLILALATPGAVLKRRKTVTLRAPIPSLARDQRVHSRLI